MVWQDAISTKLKPLLTKARLGLITDVDGTISPIVRKPEDAQVTPRNRELLRELQARLPLVAVISGRSAADIQARVGLPGLIYVGNHGFETWVDGRVEPMPEAAAFRPQLEAAIAEIQAGLAPAMQLEDKGLTLSVHYRQTSDPPAIETQYRPRMMAIAAKHGLKFFQGRLVFEFRPPVEANKGTALRQLITHHQLDAAIYLGDDTTDVDALRQAQALRAAGVCYALGVGVETDETPAAVRDNADFLVSGISEVEAFLAWLLRVHKASSN
jgi:trehalose 6-phosphate phosphatase